MRKNDCEMGQRLVNIPRATQIWHGVRSDWEAGRVAICEQQDLELWHKVVEELAKELGFRPEVQLNEATDLGFARVNKGFPVGMVPYSAEAKEWADLPAQMSWKVQLSSWNKFFGGDRGIC